MEALLFVNISIRDNEGKLTDLNLEEFAFLGGLPVNIMITCNYSIDKMNNST